MKRRTVGERLREYMAVHGLKQVDILEKTRPYFTDKVKISKTDLSQYVNSKTEPRSDKLYILAKGLGVSEQWLLGFDDGAPITTDYSQARESLGHSGPNVIDDGLSVDEAVDNLRAYQGKPISDDEKEVLKDIIKGYLDRR
ncbi:helix-turn-helix domain-containing protein [Limosilactobacillus fermentum]|uniref:helix-turn-helix domain-containing protein n=1 Tax=Limosilactobacillus fermentum TaxID=1613 RepID=UPI00249CC98D|nr:helix-turn-helix domain-containing protein [Limosilactobacillus fermentum]WGW22212.1 helix-turn-helix domain-containing protein [Limosilactobacillus fermentum]